MRPKFSVIIPTFNRCELLQETINSVLMQNYKDYELIVVDDGSTDETQRMLKGLDGKLRSIILANSGPSIARNCGATAAVGEYLAFLDSDDLWFPWTLEAYNKILAATDYPTLLRASVIEFKNPPPDGQNQNAAWNVFDDYLASSRHLTFLGSGMMLIRRDSFLAAGGFDPALAVGEDHDFAMRVGIQPGFVSVVSPPTLAYRRRPDTASGNVLRAAEDALRRIEKEHHGLYPGGGCRASDRRRYLTASIRPIVLQLIEDGEFTSGSRLYIKTLSMHLAQRRFRFLFGAVFLASHAMLSRIVSRDKSQLSCDHVGSEKSTANRVRV